MKPDQERIHTVLTDTISLLCRNGLNYEKELKIQGVIGVTVDNSEVFIVHINETFDCVGRTTDDTEAPVINPEECQMEIRPASKLIRRPIQRNLFTEYSRMTSSAKRSSRMARMKARQAYRMPGFSQTSSINLSFHAREKSPGLTNSLVSDSQMYSDCHGSGDRELPEVVEKARQDDDPSKVITIKETDEVIECHNFDGKSVCIKEDEEEDEEDEDAEDVRNYNSITSSLQDSNDARRSDVEANHNSALVPVQRIKSETGSLDAEAATPAVTCRDFSSFGSTSGLSSFLPEPRDSCGFSVDFKTEGVERHLSMESHDGLSLPLRSKHSTHSIAASQVLLTRRRTFTAQPYDLLPARKASIPSGFPSVGSPTQTEAQQNLWKMMTRFVCEVPGCNTSFSNKQNLLRHQTHKHGRQKIPRQSRAAANFYAANMAANISLPNFMDGSEG